MSIATAVTARNLCVEAVTGEVVRAFAEAGIHSLLLKGPALGRRLYSEGERAYGDSDLFVEPARLGAAGAVLRRLGFANVLVSEDVPDARDQWADLWVRAGMLVELHRTIWGVGVPPLALWQGLWRHAEPLEEVGGHTVDILSPTGLAFHTALHAAQHGARVPKPLGDLERALASFDRECWTRAGELAVELEAVPAFVAGLELLPAGERLAAELSLSSFRSTHVALRARTASAGALAVDRVVTAAGARQRLRLIRRTIFPSPKFMRVFFPVANRGSLGLTLAYSLRLGSRAWQFLPGLRTWLRVRKR